MRTLLLCAAVLLAGCGFHLQGRVPLSRALSVTYIDTEDAQSDFVQDLRRSLLGSGASLATRRDEATAILHVERDELVQRVLSVSANNLPREYELAYVVRFAVESGGRTVLPSEELSVTRDLSFDERTLLAKERERDQLREALARDLAGVVMRRLSSLP
ncbi:MAG: LPS assembly lipoprotein LptE [Steroidobacteraceae bacterium]